MRLRQRWAASHRSTRIAAGVGATLAFLLLAPIATAVVLLRCCDDARGPDAGAWIVIGLLVVVVAIVAALVAAAIAVVIRRVWQSGG